MKADEIDRILSELDQIRKRRRDRGDLFIEVVLEASKSIKDKYEKWYEKAIAELYREIELMNELVPYDEFSKYKSDLVALEKEFSSNRKNLNEFIATLENHHVKSFEGIILPSGGNESIISRIPNVQEVGKHTADFSVVLESLNIAKKVEEVERAVEKLSHFMINVITLTKRAS